MTFDWVVNNDYMFQLVPDSECLPPMGDVEQELVTDGTGGIGDASPLTLLTDAGTPDGPGGNDDDEGGGGDGEIVITPTDPSDPPIVVAPPPAPPPPPPPPPTTPWLSYGFIVGVVGEVISPATPTIQAINAPYLFSSIGSLPAGLSLNASTGVITGTPTVQTSGFYQVSCNGVVASVEITVLREGSVLPPGTPVNWTIRRIGDTFYWIYNGIIYQTWKMPKELYDQLRSSQGYLGWWQLANLDPAYSPPNTTAPVYTTYVAYRAVDYRKERLGPYLARQFGRLQALATFIEGDRAYVTDLAPDGVKPAVPADSRMYWVSPAKASILAASGLTRHMVPDAGVPDNNRIIL